MAEIEKLGMKYRVALRYEPLIIRWCREVEPVLLLHNNMSASQHLFVLFWQDSQGPKI